MPTLTIPADRPRTDPIPAAEHTALTTFLTARGLPTPLVAEAIGNTPAGQSRAAVARGLIALLKTLPAGK